MHFTQADIGLEVPRDKDGRRHDNPAASFSAGKTPSPGLQYFPGDADIRVLYLRYSETGPGSNPAPLPVVCA
jgi:hypothetical protein